jgi:shikimate kinase
LHLGQELNKGRFVSLWGLRTLIIGVAGTGKSYLVKEMRRRGFNAIDADEGLATFVDSEGKEVEYDSNGGAGWWRAHYYVLKKDKLERLLKEKDSVYLFGDVGGQPGKRNGFLDVVRFFDRVCYLKAPVELIRNRLAARNDNPFGKNADEVEGTMKHRKRMDSTARREGFRTIDATLPLDDIIKIIVGSDH